MKIGSSLGRYRITGKIGEGGMGHLTFVLNWFTELQRLLPSKN
jgi:hypothetical protein